MIRQFVLIDKVTNEALRDNKGRMARFFTERGAQKRLDRLYYVCVDGHIHTAKHEFFVKRIGD